MSHVLFVSDLHLGHRNILRHTKAAGTFRGGRNVEEHDEWVIERCLSANPTKRTLWWILGDVAMNIDRLSLIDRLPGRKILVLGNHDRFDTQVYLKRFERTEGLIKKYGMWLSHSPIHSEELRGKPNVHGHCHRGLTDSSHNYLNVAIEWLPRYKPLSLEEVRAYFERKTAWDDGGRGI